jgi:hypothetical protein
MKAYQFDPETGVYQGEVYENADNLMNGEGITLIPTPDYGKGQVPVFDPTRNIWTISPVEIVRQRLGRRIRSEDPDHERV